MRHRWLIAVLLSLPAGPVVAQDDAAEAAEAVAATEDLLDADALDDLVAPVALYPDSLLTQVLVAATYPLDVAKAGQFVDETADLDDKARADAAEGEDWDPSVVVLASGFPTVVDAMADDLDWTEELGDAMLAQTDDLLDAVQRMRARAQAAGTLASNEAQVVEETEDTISIAPADPNVVYVPSYDTSAAYGYGAPVATAQPSSGITTSDVLTTGAIAFGSAMLVDAIFDDDDDDWDDYWRGPPPIDWDDDTVFPRRGVNVDGDVNIDVDRNRVRVSDGNRIDRDRIGDREGGRIERDGAWQPSADQRQAARGKLADRQRDPGKARQKVQARGGSGDDARAKLAAAQAKRGDGPARALPSGKGPNSALKRPAGGGERTAKVASARGGQSLGKAHKPAIAAKPKLASKPRAISKPKSTRVASAPPRKVSSKGSAFKPQKGGGSRARASSSRGGGSKFKKRR